MFFFNKIENNIKPLINEYFCPNKSSSFQLDKSQLKNDYKIVYDSFNFNGNNGNYFLNFILKGYNNESEITKYNYLPEIGISNSFIIKNSNSCPNFLFELKNKNIINQNILYNIIIFLLLKKKEN